jgi:hypothetical protein
MENLDRDVAIEHSLPTAVHARHPAHAEKLDHGVAVSEDRSYPRVVADTGPLCSAPHSEQKRATLS